MDTLRATLEPILQGCAAKPLNGESYLTHDEAHAVYTVISIGHFREKRVVNAGLVVRVVGEQVIIEHDANDHPLVDALLQAGIPRSAIVLAYAGEGSAN